VGRFCCFCCYLQEILSETALSPAQILGFQPLDQQEEERVPEEKTGPRLSMTHRRQLASVADNIIIGFNIASNKCGYGM
jgi:hypothetical protein